MPILVTSDLHWGHKNIVRGESRWAKGWRNFNTVEDHDNLLRRRWNDFVQPDDTVVVLGDWALCDFDRAKQITQSLNGYKVLVEGNHDRFSWQQYRDMGFDQVVPSGQLWIARSHKIEHYPSYQAPKEEALLLSHYPWADKRGPNQRDYPYGTVLVHGHTHSSERVSSDTSICVCPEAWSFRPVFVHSLWQMIDGGLKKYRYTPY